MHMKRWRKTNREASADSEPSAQTESDRAAEAAFPIEEHPPGRSHRFARSRLATPRMPPTRTAQWRELGLESELDKRTEHRAQGEMFILALLIAGVFILFSRRQELFPGLGTEVRAITVVALLTIGWAFARALGRGLAPGLFRRLDPGTAGTFGFLVRLFAMLGIFVVALRIAGIKPETLAVGGAFTAVIVGLAAQQTLANLFAGIVLLSSRPFRVGDRVRLQGGAFAGRVEGVVGALGLLHTTFFDGADRILVPNSVLLTVAIVPLREPAAVELRARFDGDETPAGIQELLAQKLITPVRKRPHIELEEFDRDEIVVTIRATPIDPDDGSKLAGEILSVVRERSGRSAARPDQLQSVS